MAVYGSFLTSMWQGAVHNRVWRAALLVDAYAQDVDAESSWAQVQAYEVQGSGYPSGGVSVDLEVSYDATQDAVLVTTVSDSISFGVLTAPDIGALVIYAWTGNAATSPLLVVDHFNDALVSDGSEFVYFTPPEGLINLSLVSSI